MKKQITHKVRFDPKIYWRSKNVTNTFKKFLFSQTSFLSKNILNLDLHSYERFFLVFMID